MMESSTQIKNRMIKKAAQLWGVAPNEIESSFDPLISLLIEACANEIEKISRQVGNSQTRITERLIELMTPETLYGPKPAHAIAQTKAVEKETLIEEKKMFYVKKRVKSKANKTEMKNIFFSPVKPTKLINASIRKMVFADRCIAKAEGKKQAEDLVILPGKQLSFNTLFLGIETEAEGINLKNVSLYFEFSDLEFKDLFYYQLANIRVYYNDKLLQAENGFDKEEALDRNNLASVFKNMSRKTLTVETQVMDLYKKYFVTLSSAQKLHKQSKLPKELLECVDVTKHKDFNDLHWLKIEFPKVISPKMLEQTDCALNVFPILNRKIETLSYQLKNYINIIPISTTQLFLDIDEITNTAGQTYNVRDFDTTDDQKGTYVLRRDNVGKLDSRKAQEYLMQLVELLKNESASFSLFGNDFLQENIQDLNQRITLLEKKVMDSTAKTIETNYISVKPYKKRDTILVDYWVTNGIDANGIKSDTPLQIYKGAELDQKFTRIRSVSNQGKDDLTSDERLYAYRRALLSRNRIVTREDVKALCYELCAKKISHVEVTKGYKTDLHLAKGKIPCIMINLKQNKAVKTNAEEWESIKSNILTILAQESTAVFPYEIRINH
ncbi:type VI secretion system baseplate subunit TssF [Gangjinia marincola]|uniref:Type VI secretion system baseplate subunit TssF n=2 Tax=Gangjinia marincola TaxID=578463 RepID=A0ABN1MJL0_9FLAO